LYGSVTTTGQPPRISTLEYSFIAYLPQIKKQERHGRRYNDARFGARSADVNSISSFITMSNKNIPASMRDKLVRAAKKVMKNAHAPYSHFHVGSAILLKGGKIFSGCNVENASYGMTNCAERTAIFSAVAQLGPWIEIQAVAVANAQSVACSPCGACRQVIYEFGPDAIIFFEGKNGPKQAHITELLPEGFRLQ
jgi:cytidine deaminase